VHVPTPAVRALLDHLCAVGFDGAPRGFAEGTAADRTTLAGDEMLHRAAALVGDFHRASATFVPPPDARWEPYADDPDGGSVVLHGDLGGWNIIVGPDASLTIIDWGFAHPGRPEWEIAYSLISFADLWRDSGHTDAECVRRMHVFADGYRLERPRLALALDLLPRRARVTSDVIAAGAARGDPVMVRLREHDVDSEWAATADHWDARLPTWRRLLSR
jgi:Ser/Thr protein kinase RdoA (MazF antagonist)